MLRRFIPSLCATTPGQVNFIGVLRKVKEENQQ